MNVDSVVTSTIPFPPPSAAFLRAAEQQVAHLHSPAVDVRIATCSDHAALHRLFTQLDQETPYLGFMPGERSPSFFELQRQITEDTTGAKGAIFLAFYQNELAGILQAQIFPLQLLKHSLTIEIGIRQTFTGRGIGKHLFNTVETWARSHGIHRLALTVATENTRAFALYKKQGFEIEGRLRHAMLLEGHYVDDYIMAKLLT